MRIDYNFIKVVLLKAAIPLSIILLIWFSASQLGFNIALSKRLDSKRQELNKAEEANKRLDILEKESREIKEQEDAAFKQIPFNEKQPLGLIKALIQKGKEVGLKNLEIGIAQGAQEPQAGLMAVSLDINFEASFPAVSVFIERLKDIGRVVGIGMIKIERDENILPLQKVYLQLTTYTFIQ